MNVSIDLVKEAVLEEGGVLQTPWEFIVEHGAPYGLAHWLFAGWLTFISYMLSCLYFTWKDVMRHDSKIQKDYWPTTEDMLRVAIPQILIYFGLNAFFTWLFPENNVLPQYAPSVPRLLLEVSVCFVIGDFFIYWEHRIMHLVPYLRKNIHNVHHSYHAPFSWAGGWVHPLEDAVVVACQMTAPIVWGVHPLSLWIFTFVWVVLLIEEHSGHDVWWAPYQWMPFAKMPMGGGGAPHDIHHYRPNENFGFVLIIWDQIFGTFRPVVDPINRPSNYKNWWEWKGKDNSNILETHGNYNEGKKVQ